MSQLLTALQNMNVTMSVPGQYKRKVQLSRQAWLKHAPKSILITLIVCKIIPMLLSSLIKSHMHLEQIYHWLRLLRSKCQVVTNWFARDWNNYTNDTRSSKLDKDDIDQYLNFRRYNIHHSDQRSNMEVNYRCSMSRQGKCPG